MMQRFLIAMCLFLALACVGSLALSWIMMTRQHLLMLDLQAQNQQDLESQRRLMTDLEARAQKREEEWKEELAASKRVADVARAQAEQARAAELVARQRAEAQPVSDWNPVEFKFVGETKDGPPLEGVKVRLSITARETGIPSLSGSSAADGVVRFPRVRYGIYSLTVTAPNTEVHVSTVSLQPGEGLEQMIVCPTAPLDNVAVRVRVAWPDEFPADRLACLLAPSECRHIVDNLAWSNERAARNRPQDQRGGGPGVGNQLLIQNGEVANLWLSGGRVGLGGFSSFPQPGREDANPLQLFMRSFPFIRMSQLPPEIQEQRGAIVWPGAGYEFAIIPIITPLPAELISDGRFPRAGQQEIRNELTALKGHQVRYRLQPADGKGETATLWIEPLPEGIEAVRAALVKFDEMATELKPAPAAIEDRR